MVIPMLEEHEWPELAEALTEGLRNIKQERQQTGAALHEIDRTARYHKALDLYERLTGFRETNPNALWHHRVSIYGPPCHNCGKPLRTPQAKLCAACGTRRAA